MALFVESESEPGVYRMDQNVAAEMRRTLDAGDRIHDTRLRHLLQTEQSGMDTYIDQGYEIIEEIVSHLKRGGQNQGVIQRHLLGGSVAKGTSIGPAYKPDLDLYLFFRYGPSSAEVTASNADLKNFIQDKLNDIKQILSTGDNRDKYVFLYKINFAVGVKHNESGIKVDVIPAIDFGLGDSDQQYKKIMGREANAAREVGVEVYQDSNLKWINSSSVEFGIKYVRKQTQFVRDVVVLAKYWNKKCVKMRNISGRSYVVELVAMKAAQEEIEEAARARTPTQPFLVRALLKFLEMMALEYFDLSVVFKDGVDMMLIGSDACGTVQERLAHLGEAISPSGCVIDPVMPFRNLLHDEQLVDNWQDFQDAAAASMEIIHQEGDGEGKDIEEVVGLQR